VLGGAEAAAEGTAPPSDDDMAAGVDARGIELLFDGEDYERSEVDRLNPL
jgi:hypothetical protein